MSGKGVKLNKTRWAKFVSLDYMERIKTIDSKPDIIF